MKIGLLGPAEPFRGGIAQFLHNMADALNQRDDVEVYVLNFIKQYPTLFFPGKEQTIVSRERIYPFRKNTYPIFRVLTPYNPFTWKKGVESILKLDLDHLIIKFWIPFFCPAYTYIIDYIKKHSKTKIHVLAHNLDFHERWLFSDILTKRMMKNADSIIVLSENVEKSAERWRGQKRIIKLFHPLYTVPTEVAELASVQTYKKKSVLFLGFIKHYKGLDVLLRAIPLVYQENSDIEFIIAGEVYGSARKYHKIIKSFNSKYKIIFDNKFITTEEMPEYFSKADVLVAPYRTATQSGIIQLAYSFLKPVIASDIAGLREMVKDKKTGLLFENENSEDLAKKIIEFYDLREKNDFTSEIIEYNKDFTWDRFVEEMINKNAECRNISRKKT